MREKTVEWALKEKIIAIVRGMEAKDCLRVAQALYDGGIRLMEITYDQREPAQWVKTADAIGKIQQGSAWWFNDNKTGMMKQMTSLANLGLLGNFIGMLTDSRSFLSYVRHEYFRRILCNLLGKWVEDGECPRDKRHLNRIVRDICCKNAVRYFGFNLNTI